MTPSTPSPVIMFAAVPVSWEQQALGSPAEDGQVVRARKASKCLAGDDAAPADLQVGELAGAHLVIRQVAGQAGNRCGLINAVSQPLVQVRTAHRFHLDHLNAGRSVASRS